MSKIPTHLRQVMPSGNSGLARANPQAMSDTGEAGKFLAIGNAGAQVADTIAKVSTQLAEAEHRSLLSTAERKRDERMFSAVREIEDTPFPEDSEQWKQTTDKIWQAAQKDIQTYTPKVKWVADIYTNKTNEQLPYHQAQINNISRKKRFEAVKISNEINMKSAVEKGDFVKVGDIAADNVATGIWTKDQGKEALMEAKYQINKNSQWAASLAMGGDGIAYLSDPRKTPGLEINDRQKMVQSLIFFNNQQKEVADKQRLAAAETDKEFIVKSIRSDGPALETESFILNSKNLSAEEKNTWLERIDRRYGSSKDKRFEESDPQTYLKYSRAVHLGEKVTKAEIFDLVGKKEGGLSTDDAEKLIKLMEGSRGGDKTSSTAMAYDQLENLWKEGYFIYKADEDWSSGDYDELNVSQRFENDKIYKAVLTDFEEFIKKTPDATDQQITDKMQSLIEPSKKQVALSFWGTTLWNGASDEQELRNKKLWNELVENHKTNQTSEAGVKKYLDEADDETKKLYEDMKKDGLKDEDFIGIMQGTMND